MFEETLRSLLVNAQQSNELAGLLTGLELADERGWLDPIQKQQLVEALEEEKVIDAAFDADLLTLTTRYPDKWKAWLERRIERLRGRPDPAPNIITRLGHLLSNEPSMEPIAWALAIGDALEEE